MIAQFLIQAVTGEVQSKLTAEQIGGNDIASEAGAYKDRD
jgi:hypothetical protein